MVETTALKVKMSKCLGIVFHDHFNDFQDTLTSQKLYSKRFAGGPVFLNKIFDFSGIFQPFGVVTRAIHCYE